MAGKYNGSNVINGTHGKLWWNGYLIAEIASFEAKITINREDVIIGLDNDSNMVSLTGEGTMKFTKVYSRGKKAYLEAIKRGEDPRSELMGQLKSPNAIGKQTETCILRNVWANELPLMMFEKGSKIEEEISFGFTPSDSDMPDEILAA